MRHSVGDVVTIREDLVEVGKRGDFEYHLGYNDNMGTYAGKKVTIRKVLESNEAYLIEEDNGVWYWSDEMLASEVKAESVKKEKIKMEHNAIKLINKTDVMEKMWDTLNLCNIYHPTDKGMNTIYDEWSRNKGEADVWNGMSVLDIISKHPDYVPEKGYIVKKQEYDRPVDFKVIKEVIRNIYNASFVLLQQAEIKPFSFNEIKSYIEMYETLVYYARKFDYPSLLTYKGMTFDEMTKEKRKWEQKYGSLINSDEYYIDDSTLYTKESHIICRNFQNLFSRLLRWIESKQDSYGDDDVCDELLIDKDIVDYIEASGLNVKGIREGQKFHKVVGKILREIKFDTKWYQYNSELARLGDASSPLKYTRFTILSANPVDYWRMSFGSSWSSCHTIDKAGYFSASRGGQNFGGMHASGPESYMLDVPSLIMYTVSNEYDGNDYEMQPKINRCMFHIGEGKFIMGRIYPQGRDGEKDIYKQWRNTFQTIIAECLEIPNYWKTEYDTENKLNQIETSGTHYPDYECDYCNIAGWSWHKPFADSEPSSKIIKIGHDPICPCCGEEHCVEDNIECEDCNENYDKRCEYCDEGINRDSDDYYTDGNGRYWCCLSHANADDYYLAEDDDGYVHRYDDLYYEELSETYWLNDYDAVETTDGNWFHDSDAAEYYGYEYYDEDGEWHPDSDFEEDSLTGERFPYWSDTSGYYEHDGSYFINEENMNEWIAENESSDDEDEDEEESEVA